MTAIATAPAPRAAGRRLRRAGRGLGTLLFILAAVALLATTVAPRVFHFRAATMLTGSMVPTVNPGDVIIDVQENASDLRVGQIVTYHIPVEDHRVESHRVSWVGHDAAGNVLFRTKGDANNGVDPWTAKVDGPTVWRVVTVLPVVGDVIRLLRQPVVQIIATRVIPVLLVGWLLLSIWRPARKRSAHEPEVNSTDANAEEQTR
jgi:signal peptidase I